MFDFGKIYDVKEIIEDVSLSAAKKVFYNKQIPNIYNHRSAARECRAGNRPFFCVNI